MLNEVCSVSEDQLGLCDLIGNLSEFVLDTKKEYSSKITDKNNEAAAVCDQTNCDTNTKTENEEKVCRGGNWATIQLEQLYVYSRDSLMSHLISEYIGFRIAKSN